MHPTSILGGLLALAALPAFAATAPTTPSLNIPRVGSDITVDGVLDEPVWAEASMVDVSYEVSPGDNLPAPVKTTARIAYTEDAVLLAFHAEDPDPSKLRAFLRDRDALYSDDFIGVMLDTFDDQRRAYEFFVNPLGVQADLIKEEATGNEDDSWDGLWTSAARITAQGYDAELRIPFATLRFHDTDGVRRWGASFIRIRPREFRYQYFSHRVERGARCLVCTFDKIEGFAGAKQGRNLEITPTFTALHTQERATPDASWQSQDTDFEPGLDVAWSPSPNLTLNGTLNPDFSQVETDQAQLDLNTSFALFFPEKRPFFLEGADYFTTPLQVLYTRQIADPDAGLRMTSHNDRQAFGVIAATDAVTQLLMPGVLGSSFRSLDQEANVLVGRYRYDLDAHTSLGAVTTARQGEDYRNVLTGFDGRWQNGAHTLSGQWLRSDSTYPDELALADATPRGNAMLLAYTFGNRDWTAKASHTRIDPGFRADVGFISQVGYDKSVIGGGHNWYGEPGAAISKVQFYGDWDITHRYDGLLLERELEAYVSIKGPRQSFLEIGGLGRVRYWNGTMLDEGQYSISGEITPWSGVEFNLYHRGGRQTDLVASRPGHLTVWEPTVSLDIGRGVHVQLDYTQQWMDRDGGTAFEAKLLDGRMSWQFDPRQRLRLSVQASDIRRDQALYTQDVDERTRDVAAQLLYSYKVNPRTALYAGYSQGGYADDLQESFFNNTRSVFLKLSYAWQPQF